MSLGLESSASILNWGVLGPSFVKNEDEFKSKDETSPHAKRGDQINFLL